MKMFLHFPTVENKLLFILIVAVVVFPRFSFSQYDESNTYDVTDGLVPESTTSVIQCNQGYIWTINDGLINRFDGKRFWHYPSPPDSLTGSDIIFKGLSLYQDSLLFLFTTNHIFLLNPTSDTWQSFSIKKNNLSYTINDFHQQGSDDIILHCLRENGTDDNYWSYLEFWRFKNKKIEPIELLEGMYYCNDNFQTKSVWTVDEVQFQENKHVEGSEDYSLKCNDNVALTIDSLDNKYLIYFDTLYIWQHGENHPRKLYLGFQGDYPESWPSKRYQIQLDDENQLIIFSAGFFFILDSSIDTFINHPFNREFKYYRNPSLLYMDNKGNLGTHDMEGNYLQYNKAKNTISLNLEKSKISKKFFNRRYFLSGDLTQGTIDHCNITWYPSHNGLIKALPQNTNTHSVNYFSIKESDKDLSQDSRIIRTKRNRWYSYQLFPKESIAIFDESHPHPRPVYYPKFGGFTEDNNGNIYCIYEDNIVQLDLEKKDSVYTIFRDLDRSIDVLSTSRGILLSSGRLLNPLTGELQDIKNAHPKINPDADIINHLRTQKTHRWQRNTPFLTEYSIPHMRSYQQHFSDLLLKDNDNEIWRANDSMLYLLDQSKPEWKWVNVMDTLINNTTEYRQREKLESNFEELINTFHFGKTSNKLWMGFRSGKLLSYSKQTKKLERFELVEKGKYICINVIEENSEGNLWLGTEKGLYHFNPSNNQKIKYEDNRKSKNEYSQGFYQSYISGLLPDGDSCFWLKDNYGFSRFHIKNKTFFNIVEETGDLFHPSEANASFVVSNSYFKASNGQMFFGNQDSIISFSNEDIFKSIKETNRSAKMVLSSFEYVDIKEQKVIKQYHLTNHSTIQLEREGKYLTFEFSNTDFHSPEKTLYSYRLKGHVDDWSILSDDNIARFANLTPGKYSFQAKAYHQGQILYPEQLNIKLIVTPPWWNTNLAYFFYLLILAGMMYAIFSFVKKRLQLQAQLKLEQQEALRLKELDTFKSKLYTNLTHEFRTPLTVILGMVQQVRNEPKKYLDEGTRMIETNGRNLLRLINQLLDLSKLEDRSFQLKLQQSDIIPFLKYITESFHTYVNSKNLTLQFFSPLESLIMDHDPEQIKQALTNLISNAVKFTPSGGKISVRVTSENNHLNIDVRDSGIGIAKKDLAKIFDRFYQVDGSMTREGEGTGIGLAHTQELVKLMDGKISAKSIIGKGSSFLINIPIRQNAQIVETSINENQLSIDLPFLENQNIPIFLSPEKQPVANLPQLLIIEDNPDVVHYLKSCLENFYQIDIALNGKIGIEKATENIPDLIISDVMMPEKDGYQVCDFLKNDERTSHIPIILLTAKADSDSKIIGLKRGADAYLSKPFDKKELLVRLEKLVERQQKMQTYFSTQNIGQTQKIEPRDIEEAIIIEDAFIQKVKKIIEENYSDENFALPQLCQKIRMSRSQLFRKMKALVNTSPSDYIRKYRLEKAKYLLENTNKNVSEVSWEIGFKDLSHFSKTFQAEFGYLPSATNK